VSLPTPKQISDAITAIQALSSDGVTAWLAGFSDPSAIVATVEDVANLIAICDPPLGPEIAAAEAFVPALELVAQGIIWAAQHPNEGAPANQGPGNGDPLGIQGR
jgi:hypothetical protein